MFGWVGMKSLVFFESLSKCGIKQKHFCSQDYIRTRQKLKIITKYVFISLENVFFAIST